MTVGFNFVQSLLAAHCRKCDPCDNVFYPWPLVHKGPSEHGYQNMCMVGKKLSNQGYQLWVQREAK